MFNSHAESYPGLKESFDRTNLSEPAAAQIELFDVAHLHVFPAMRWGVQRIDAIMEFCSRSFPKLEVLWSIQKHCAKNASAFPAGDLTAVLITTGAIDFLHKRRLKFAFNSFRLPYGVPAPDGQTHQPVSDEEAVRSGEYFALFAFSALVGHELGHAHDRHFEGIPSADPLRLQAQEISADLWAVRLLVEQARLWALAQSERGVPYDAALNAGLFYGIVGLGAMMDIDWTEDWNAPGKTYPANALRLVAGAVAMYEWVEDRQFMAAAGLAARSRDIFAAAARTLNYLATEVLESEEYFKVRAKTLYGDGSRVDSLRAAYEGFRAELPLRRASP